MLGKLFKKYFIPHEGNDHKPRILRSGAFMSMLLVILFVETIFVARSLFLLPNTDFLASILPPILIADTNANRANDNLQSLQTSARLTEAAQLKANDMAAKGYFSHVSPTGVTPWHWFDQVGYNYEYAGENLAVNFTDSQDVINAWMNSPEHRANILSVNFSQIGIAAASGTYEGRPAIFVVQLFGRPAPIAALAPTAPSQVAVAPVAPPATVPSIAPNTTAPEVKGAMIELPPAVTASQPSFAARMASEPHSPTNYFYLALLALVGVALALNILIKKKIQHPQLIANGFMIIFLVVLTLLVNNFIAVHQAGIL